MIVSSWGRVFFPVPLQRSCAGPSGGVGTALNMASKRSRKLGQKKRISNVDSASFLDYGGVKQCLGAFTLARARAPLL